MLVFFQGSESESPSRATLNLVLITTVPVSSTGCVHTTLSAACVDIDQYLDIPSPMTGDMEINLDGVDTIACVEIQVPGEAEPNLLETVIVDGGTLTIKSSSSVRYEIRVVIFL